MNKTITSPKLRDLASLMDRLDTIREYWDDGEKQTGKPTKLAIVIQEGSALPGNREFCEELSRTVLENWDKLFYDTMRRLERETDSAADQVGIQIRDPKRGS